TQDIQVALSGFNDGQRNEVLKDPSSRHQVVNNLIDQELLTEQASKEKLDQSAAYREAMAAFSRQYLANELLQRNLASEVTQSAAKSFYETHKNRYSTDAVHVGLVKALSRGL